MTEPEEVIEAKLVALLAAALPDEGWTLPLLKEAGYLLDYVSIHGYWDFLAHVDNPAPYLDCMLRTERPEADIRRTIDVLERVGMRGRVKIAFDEWNLRGWHHPGHGSPKMDVAARDKNDKNSTYTMADALFSACFLNSCLRYGRDVEIACFSPMQSSIINGPYAVASIRAPLQEMIAQSIPMELANVLTDSKLRPLASTTCMPLARHSRSASAFSCDTF